MLIRRICISAISAIASLFIVASANAITIKPHPFDINDLNIGVEYDTPNPTGVLGDPGVGIGIGLNTTFNNHYYGFNVIDMPFEFKLVFLKGFTDLKVSIVDASNVIVNGLTWDLTDDASSGGSYSMVPTLLPNGLYKIFVEGVTDGSGVGSRKYSLSVQAVPVPPALLLLVSGLMGAGFMGRRKLRSSKVSV